MLSYYSAMRNGKNAFLLKSYPFYMKYKQNSPFGGHFGRHLEFQYEESTFRLGTRARKFAHCIIFNIKLSNLFSGGGGAKTIFCSTGFCTICSFKIFENIQKRKGMPVYNNEFLSVTLNNVYITFDQCI